jgi:CRISPR-associated protein Csx10
VTGPGTLRVTVTARQRLALGVASEVSYFTGTHSFAPGSVLRGALAAAWIAENGPPTAGSGAAFRELFDGPVRYGPMFVPGTAVVPVSVRRCKYPRDARCASQAVDEAFETGRDCPACHGPLEPGKGQVMLPAGITEERITRTSIDPQTGKAADGELYAHGALPAGTILTGYIYGRDPWLERPRRLRLGGRRTVSGAADYQAVPLRPAEEDQVPNDWPGLPSTTESGRPAERILEPSGHSEVHLVIRLVSPAIFVDAAGRPSLEPDPLLDLGGARVSRRWARPVIWSGWHAASRLPKPEEVCAVAGSTYVITGPPGTLHELAERLPRDGAGLRRTEGFGDIRLATQRPSPARRPRRRMPRSPAGSRTCVTWPWTRRSTAGSPMRCASCN